MNDKDFVNQTQFANILAEVSGTTISKQYITKLKREDKLIFNDDGKVDVKKTLKKLGKLSDPSKSNATKKIINDIPKDVRGDLTDDEINDILQNEDPNDYNQSKSRKEYFLSKMAQVNYLKECGKLIETELVERQYFNLSRQTRDKIFNIKMRISSKLSIMNDSTEIANLLDKEFRLVFKEIEEQTNDILKEQEEEDDDSNS